MTLSGKHLFGSIDETRVTFVEKKVDASRIDFLKKILEHNNFEVIIQEEKRRSEEDPQLYSLGVTDMVFNPTIYIFQRRLLTLDGKKMTQDYWFQRTEDAKPQYWKNSK
jgi:hypothetical protein